MTGFIGTGTIPTPIADEEMKALQKRMGVEEPKYKIDVTVGAPVRIVDGPFKNFEGKVAELDEAHGKSKSICECIWARNIHRIRFSSGEENINQWLKSKIWQRNSKQLSKFNFLGQSYASPTGRACVRAERA